VAATPSYEPLRISVRDVSEAKNHRRSGTSGTVTTQPEYRAELGVRIIPPVIKREKNDTIPLTSVIIVTPAPQLVASVRPAGDVLPTRAAPARPHGIS